MKLPVTYLLTFSENKEVHAIDSEWSELIRKFGQETVDLYLNSCNEDYACGDGDCIFYKEDGCLWHDAEKKEK